MLRFKIPDGGRDSGVHCWGIEIKGLFSILLLRFKPNERENFHSHAFNALTFWIWGVVAEMIIDPRNYGLMERLNAYTLGDFKITPRNMIHKIYCDKPAWAITFRGPWLKTWTEFNTETRELITLSKGRVVEKVEIL